MWQTLVLVLHIAIFLFYLHISCCVGKCWTDRNDTYVFHPMYIFILLTYVISSLHLLLALTSIIVGIISQSRSPVWIAHSVSPIWSGIFVRFIDNKFVFKRKLTYIFILVCVLRWHWNNMCTPKRSLCGKWIYFFKFLLNSF